MTTGVLQTPASRRHDRLFESLLPHSGTTSRSRRSCAVVELFVRRFSSFVRRIDCGQEEGSEEESREEGCEEEEVVFSHNFA